MTTDVINSAAEVQDEDDLEPESITLTTTRRSISAEDTTTEEMEEALDNETTDFNRDLKELGDELNEEDT